jgi:2-oxoisovalerate dehydrogenase E1 component
MESITIDGNDILKVYDTINRIADSMRENPRPYLVECITFRMRGHEEASGVKYVPKELIEEWGKLDPVINYENHLLKERIINAGFIEQVRGEIKHEIDAATEIVFAEREITADTVTEVNDVYAPFHYVKAKPADSQKKQEKRFVDAITDGLRLAMQKHNNLILMGQDIAEYGGAFKVTEGFVQQFGKDRVRNTTLCESAIIGIALGLSVKGFKSMVEMQFADFVTCGFNQIINNLAKIHYRWGQNADVVVRMPTGAGVGAGPFHSQSNEAWFVHTPGLKVLYPSTPYDAKGLLLSAFEDPNPTMFFEHKALYRSISGEVPDEYYTIEIGKAKLVEEGDDISIITYGAGVHWVLDTLKNHPEISADVIDLRTLLPYDKDAIVKSVNKTGKALIVHEDTLTGGIGGEIAAFISENCFTHLDAPVMRCTSLDTPVPFAIPLEKNFLANARLNKTLDELMKY